MLIIDMLLGITLKNVRHPTPSPTLDPTPETYMGVGLDTSDTRLCAYMCARPRTRISCVGCVACVGHVLSICFKKKKVPTLDPTPRFSSVGHIYGGLSC